MSLEIISGGFLTTVQDVGRFGFQQDGVVVGGAMDTTALRVANLLVGNEAQAAGLEITLQGPTVRFKGDALIALTGADLSGTVEGQPVKQGRPVFVRKGSVLRFGQPRSGCRAYLAISGGVAVPVVLGSRSTYLRGAFGGFCGRTFQAGDVLPVPGPTTKVKGLLLRLKDKATFKPMAAASFLLDPELLPECPECPVVRAIKGPEYELFSENSQSYIWEEKFKVSAQSDRMGYRLQGVTLSLAEPKELLSSAVTFGTVQVPPEGNPIVLMADRQTTGGYPRIGQVISADLSILAQVRPGQNLRFQEVTLEKAQEVYLHREKKRELLERALTMTVWT